MIAVGRARPQRRWRWVSLGALVLLLLPYGDYYLLNRRAARVPVVLAGSETGTNFLLVGSDSRSFISTAAERANYADAAQATGERADVLVILRVPRSGPARALVLPRDLLVRADGPIPRRLTTALLAGPSELTRRICSNLGIGVDHLVLLNFPGLMAAVDAVGGLPVTIAAPLRDERARLLVPRAGKQRLTGAQTLAYVRSRHPQELRDGRWQSAPSLADRLPRLLLSLRYLAKKSSNPLTAHRIAWRVSPFLRLDSDFGLLAQWRLFRGLGQLSAGAQVLPHTLTAGSVPVAQLTPAAEEILATWRTQSCALR